MNATMRFALLSLCGALLCGKPALSQSPASPTDLVIEHVIVIDIRSGALLPNRTVVVRDQRIAAAGPSAGVQPGRRRARVIDGHGKYLIPGLWDMHVHTVFGDWVPPDEHITLPMLDGPTPHFPASAPVANAEDGRRVVDDLKAQGVDFIKIQSYIPRDGYFAAAQEAKRIGITFVGHVPDVIRASEASNAGQKSIEHFTGIFEGCTTIEDQLIEGPKTLGLNVKYYDSDRAKILIALMAKNQTWQVPTLVWERGQWLIDDIDLHDDPLTKYAPQVWRRAWPGFTQDIIKNMDTDPLAVRKQFVQMELDMTRSMFRAGVPFMAGTDTAAGVHVFPGFSLHQELALFVKAGLTPLQALQTATLSPAKFPGRDDMGSIERGNVADLVLLNANPLDNIDNTRKIEAVVLNGRYLSHADLARMLTGIEAAAAASK